MSTHPAPVTGPLDQRGSLTQDELGDLFGADPWLGEHRRDGGGGDE
jgi:hypothetical protein